MFKSGDVVLAKMQFVDTMEMKIRPALVLYEELDNFVVAGITSNPNMKGILLTTKDGAVVDSVIKLNYIFTVSKFMISKNLFHLSSKKKKEVHAGFLERIKLLVE